MVPLTQEISRAAGHLLAEAKLGSAHAVDAFIVATAMHFDTALIATGDPKDIKRIVGNQACVKVFSIKRFTKSAVYLAVAAREEERLRFTPK